MTKLFNRGKFLLVFFFGFFFFLLLPSSKLIKRASAAVLKTENGVHFVFPTFRFPFLL